MDMSRSSYRADNLNKTSFHSRLKRPFNNDEQVVKSDSSENITVQGKRQSASSFLSVTPKKMQATNSSLDESTVGIPSRLCSVCGDTSTGIHFGGNSCESCKAFFRRSVQCNRHQNYKCSNEERCPVNLVSRKVCQYCRYKKCTTIGMKPKWVLSDQERQEKYGARRKRFRQTGITEEDPDIYKYLSKEEKVLVEDIAHALYQSRATYPLQFPAQLTEYLKLLLSGVPPPTPPSTSEKPANPSANFLIIPIQRLVLFARMLKDFDSFSEDDKVNLLKGSAVEVIVCSSNTLFDPITHTFTNYLSRDQRAVMDEQIIPLDPLLIKLWGTELFHSTKHFLISMCNLNIDEVTSTLLVPVILFSPDRSNVKDLDLVKHLQIKYVTLLRKYMNWRYGREHAEQIYPKLLLQIVNIRTLSLAHAEIIQKVMSTSDVDPLVKEVTTADNIHSRSTTSDNNMTDCGKTTSLKIESTLTSDDDETSRKKSRPSVDDDDSNETNMTNIWKKRPRLSTNIDEINLTKTPDDLHSHFKQDFLRSNSSEYEKHLPQTYPQKKPHDHQVPHFASAYPNDLMISQSPSSLRHLPPKKQTLFTNRDPSHEQMYRTHSSSTLDLSSNEHYLRSNPSLPPLAQQYTPISPATFQQDFHLLSLANKQSAFPSNSPQSFPAAPLDADEQQLLNAIHAHPNKRDLVLNLLRQMNETPSIDSSSPQGNYHLQQQYRTDSSADDQHEIE